MSTTTTVYGLTKHARGDTPWDVEVNGDFDIIDAELSKPRIIFNSPVVGATTTCDLSLGRVFVFTVSQATTLAFTNVPTSSFCARIRLLVTNGAAFVLTFPGSVTWLGGSAPVLKTSGVDEVELVTKDGGTTWYASLRAGESRLQVGAAAAVAKPVQTLYQNGSLSTGSTSDVSLASYSLPASALSANNQAVRITVTGTAVAQIATLNVKFGAMILCSSFTVASGDAYAFVAIVKRTGAAAEVSTSTLQASTVANGKVFPNSGTDTMSSAILIDFRGSVVSGGTLNMKTVDVEYLAA